MNREALIEQLARDEFSRIGHKYGQMSVWLGVSEEVREEFRNRYRTAWPRIVAFVSDWLSENGAIDQSDGAPLGQRWLEEMEMTDA